MLPIMPCEPLEAEINNWQPDAVNHNRVPYHKPINVVCVQVHIIKFECICGGKHCLILDGK